MVTNPRNQTRKPAAAARCTTAFNQFSNSEAGARNAPSIRVPAIAKSSPVSASPAMIAQ